MTLIDEDLATEPGFRALTPEEYRARVPAAALPPSSSNNRGPLPQLPDFGVSFQAPDLDKQKRERELKEKEESTRKQQDELKKMQEELKKRYEELKRQQDDFKRKQEDEKRKREDEKRRQEDEKRARERKREEEKPKRQLKPSAPVNNPVAPVTTRVEQKKSTEIPSNTKKNDPKKDDDKNDKKKEDEKKNNDNNKKTKTGRRPLPKRYEVPKNAGVGGNLGGKIPDPGIVIQPSDRYTGSSGAFSNFYSPSMASLLLAAVSLCLFF